MKAQYLENIKTWAEEIGGQWNGDKPGIEEDRAGVASDIVEAVKNLQELLDEMDELL